MCIIQRDYLFLCEKVRERDFVCGCEREGERSFLRERKELYVYVCVCP